MSVTVRHLNADSSFLLTFSPDPIPSSPDRTTPHTNYSVLIDPWLEGASIVNHPWFAITKHNVPASIDHLSELEVPDLVIVSQNKPDHCHGETLRQLRPEGKTIFAAEPGAAKAIKGWNHFDPARVFALPKYNPGKKFSLLRFHIPPLGPDGDAGEVTVAFMPAKNYMTGLHNGIGITYQAPTAVKTKARITTIDIPRTMNDFDIPFSPATLPPSSPTMPFSPIAARPGTSDGIYSRFEAPIGTPIIEAEDDINEKPHASFGTGLLSPPSSPMSKSITINSRFSSLGRPPTPPESPLSSSAGTVVGSLQDTNTHTPSSSFSSRGRPSPLDLTKTHPARPRPLSILYTPHGVPMSDVLPYVQHHLIPTSALPLTILLHSFSRATNPWYLGGNIMSGSSNGIEIARSLMAKVWLSAHDEDKDDRGFSVKKLKVQYNDPEVVRKLLYADDESTIKARRAPKEPRKDGEKWRKNGWSCDVRNLGVGKSMVISAGERDLVETAPQSFMALQQRILGQW